VCPTIRAVSKSATPPRTACVTIQIGFAIRSAAGTRERATARAAPAKAPWNEMSPDAGRGRAETPAVL